MNSKNRDWTHNVAQRLRNSTEKANDSVWESIKKDLESTQKVAPVLNSRNRRRKIIVALSSVAAVILLGLVVSPLFNSIQDKQPNKPIDKIAEKEQNNSEDNSTKISEDSIENNIQKFELDAKNIERATKKQLLASTANNNSELENETNVNKTDIDKLTKDINNDTPKELESNKIETEEKQQIANNDKKSAKNNDELKSKNQDWLSDFERANSQPRSNKKTKKRWSTNLYGTGLFAMSSGGNSNQNQLMSTAPALIPFMGDMVTTQRIVSYNYQHYQPISVGLSASLDIGASLDLGVGLNYTFMHSKAIAEQPNNEDLEQRYHFIGLPVSFNWKFVDKEKFSVYTGIEAVVEKCVGATLGNQNIDEKGVQFSGSFVVGAQYRVLPIFSIYVEPKLTHYFTQTVMPTLRPNKDIVFNLQPVVRFTF